MGMFDDNTVSGISLSGEHITTKILHDIMDKRSIYDKQTLKEKWDALLWRIYECVKYDKEPGMEASTAVSPWSMGIRSVYNNDTWGYTEEFKQFYDYFHDRGFEIQYDSLNDSIIIRW